jgi:hypothetical protein
MTNHTKTLQALVAAGDEATQGEWVKHRYSENTLLKKHQSGQSVCSANYHGGENRDQSLTDIEFIAQSANARPALKAILDELKEKDRVMAVMAEAIDKLYEDIGGNCGCVNTYNAYEKAVQALAQFEKIKGDE